MPIIVLLLLMSYRKRVSFCAMSRAALSPLIKEAPDRLSAGDAAGRCPADVFVPNWPLNRGCAFDVTAVSPFAAPPGLAGFIHLCIDHIAGGRLPAGDAACRCPADVFVPNWLID